MPRYAKGELADIPTRKHCSVCKRWLLISLNFRPRGWVEDGSRPTHVSSNCNSCHKQSQKDRHNPKLTAEYLRHRSDQEMYLLEEKLNAIDFRLWLTQRCQEIGIGNVAASVGTAQRIVYTYIVGTYQRKYKDETKRYPINYMQVDTVERFAIALGYHWSDIYPHIAHMERTVVRQRLYARGIRVPKSAQQKLSRPHAVRVVLDPIGEYRSVKNPRRDTKRQANLLHVEQDPQTQESQCLQEFSHPVRDHPRLDD